jgi:hypothetical protein
MNLQDFEKASQAVYDRLDQHRVRSWVPVRATVAKQLRTTAPFVPLGGISIAASSKLVEIADFAGHYPHGLALGLGLISAIGIGSTIGLSCYPLARKAVKYFISEVIGQAPEGQHTGMVDYTFVKYPQLGQAAMKWACESRHGKLGSREFEKLEQALEEIRGFEQELGQPGPVTNIHAVTLAEIETRSAAVIAARQLDQHTPATGDAGRQAPKARL